MKDAASLVTALQTAIPEIPPSDAPGILAQLAGVITALGARLASRGTADSGAAPAGWMSLAELAQRTTLGKSTIRKRMASGDLQAGVHFNRVGRRVVFFPEALEHLQRTPQRPASVPLEVIPFERRGRRRG